MRIWRCVQKDKAANAFMPTGQVRGRWNEANTQVVYAAETAALAVLEVAVNLGDLRLVRVHNVLVGAEIPDNLVKTVDESTLPSDWKHFPHPASTRAIGDAWLQSAGTLGLAIPSAIVPGRNIMLNASHPEFSRLTIATETYRVAPYHQISQSSP